MASAAITSVNTATSVFTWPNNPSEKLGLSGEEIKSIQRIIIATRENLPPQGGRFPVSSIVERKDGAPRRIIVLKEFSIVVLNSKGGMTSLKHSGSQQDKIKLAYVPEQGAMCIKKSVFNRDQFDLLRVISTETDKRIKGFARIFHVEERISNGSIKMRYFEKLYLKSSFSMWAESSMVSLKKTCIVLQNALQFLHSVSFQPNMFKVHGKRVINALPMRCYHGDISPNNIVVKAYENGKVSLRWIDWGAALQQDSMFYTPGWESPEFAREFHNTAFTKVHRFHQKYAVKRDVWSFALLVGSLLQGGCYVQQKGKHNLLPRFQFVLNKLNISDSGKINSKALAELTQEVVDQEIDGIIASLSSDDDFKSNTDTTEDSNVHNSELLTSWNIVKRWLRVDPDQRPTLEEVFIE